ncbi:MAG: biotin/lipoyl-binding protein [Acidobacteria bacterium]|nr:biotin/lipoyl-binding protein [Acidobacteriota bacterium]
MKLQAEIDGKIEEVILVRQGDLVRASVGGREYELTASEPETGVHLFKVDGRVFEAGVSSKGNEFSVDVGGQQVGLTLVDPKRLRGSGSGDHHSEGRAEIKTAMPGKVVRILVESGQQVAKGDAVIIVEAMKMQNEMKSPKDGSIAEIRASEGDTVGAGDVLVVIE